MGVFLSLFLCLLQSGTTVDVAMWHKLELHSKETWLSFTKFHILVSHLGQVSHIRPTWDPTAASLIDCVCVFANNWECNLSPFRKMPLFYIFVLEKFFFVVKTIFWWLGDVFHPRSLANPPGGKSCIWKYNPALSGTISVLTQKYSSHIPKYINCSFYVGKVIGNEIFHEQLRPRN